VQEKKLLAKIHEGSHQKGVETEDDWYSPKTARYAFNCRRNYTEFERGLGLAVTGQLVEVI
jgi:hypothetical protein